MPWLGFCACFLTSKMHTCFCFIFLQFSFKALNFSDKHSSCDLDSSNSSNFGANDHGNSHLPERVGHAILSNDYQSATPKTTIIPSVCKSSDLGEISPNVISLLKPTKARESEEVRVIKLYHIALRLCSSDCPDDEPKARPVLESILNSFVIESNKLTPQLASVKFASCKLLGGIYFKLNKDAEGIDLLSKALQVDSNDLSLWIRLARAAIRSGFFEVAINSIDHILTKRPSHPLALQLALPLYFAVSELEICLELSVRMLQIDPFSEYAVYFINRILTIQPSLHEMIHDLFLQRPDILNQLPSCDEAEQIDQEIQNIRIVYRKQKDAETEPQKIPLVKFPSPLKHLSWLHLIQETITMYDRLNMESAIHSVLDLTSLLCKNLMNFESVPNEINEVSNNTVTTSSSSASFISKLGEQLNDNIEHAVNSNIEKVPNVDAVYDTMKDDVGDLNIEASNDDLNATAGLEKRRSSRVRACFDLTDGLNRYCSRRSVVAELEKVSDKCKPSSEKLASSQKESDYVNDRFKLIDRFQTLLPQVFRDLGAFDQKQKLSKELQTTPETLIPCTDSFTEISSNCLECVTSNFSNMWSQKSVHEFLVLLNNMKPNIITFGISLLLQTSRLSGYRWSLEFATEYLNLFDRLQPSFPYLLTTPPSSSFSSSSLLPKAAIDQDKIQPEPCLLPEDVLALKVAPELHHLAFFYIIYIELYLEELESTSHNSTKSKEKISRPTEIPTPVFSVLNDLLAGFEETSSDYPIVMSHLLWMHYLMSSQRRDYVEMKECVLALKKLIIEHKLVVVRSYSVHHGDLTVDYMNHLLIKLKDVSSFDHLIQLSNEGQHEAVVTELIKTFQIQRNINSKPSSSDPYDHYHSIIKQLDLCYGSLKHLIMNLTLNNDKIVRNNNNNNNNNSPSCETNHTTTNSNKDDSSVHTKSSLNIHSLYCYCTAIIEECLILLNRLSQDEQVITDGSIRSVGSIIIKIIKFLNRCWILMSDEYVNDNNESYSNQSTVKLNTSTDIFLYGNLSLKLFTSYNNTDDDDDVIITFDHNDSHNGLHEKMKNNISTENNQLDSFNNHDDDYDMSVNEMNSNKITSWLTISEACRTVTVLIDLLICIIRTSVNLLSNWKMNFYLQLISLIYEHLYCIEHNIPCSALPIELRIYRFDAELPVDDIPFELKVNAYSGTVSAPPSIACLHLFHELSLVLFAYNQMSSVNIPCRDCPDLLKLLVQIVIRSSRQLQLLSAKFYSPDLRTYLETGNRSDYPTDKIISFNKISTECSTILQTNEEFVNPVSPDDNTIACTDDLQKSITYKSWPIDCVCLTQVLSCAVKCLLGGSLTREITTVYQSTMEKYLFLELLESSDFEKLFDCIKNKSVDNYVNFLPEWINTLKNLYTSSDIFDHPYLQQPLQQNSLNKPNWWNPATIDDQQRSLDWECVKVIFLISYPNPFPEYDSIKTLSISTEMLKFLCDASKLISTSESKKILPKSEIDMIIQSKVKDTQHLPSVPKGLSFLTKSMYYLIADHYMKNNHFDRAVEYYLQDLRVSPQRVDTWASLGLIYSSELEQVLNLTNLKTERVSAEAVTRCLRCFNVALYLQPDTVTLLIERGCLAYQLHSYGARIVKKSEYRNFPDAHLNLCRKWRYRMLQLARSSYESVLNLCNIMKHQQTTTTTSTQEVTINDTNNKNEYLNTRLENYSSDNNNNNNNNTNKLVQQSKEEEEAWLCHYMLAKCAEKDVQLMKQSDDIHSSISSKSSSSSRSYLMHVLHLYYESLKALDLAGAKYPKKIIVYNKIPFRAVEAIEVYYRIHALSLKTLLKHGPPPTNTNTTVTNQSSKSTYSMYPINLIELDHFLTMINSSDFVTSAKKPSRRTRKRTANMAGLSNKHNHLQKSVNQLGSCENHNKQMGINETNITESNADKLVQPLDSKLNTISSQDEFIDLVSPDPHIVIDEEESTNLLEPSSSRSSINECANKLGLWKKCIDRCRCALELVLQRLPLHYKAMYRLASLYLHASHLKDPSKALDILLGPTDESQKHLASTHVNTLNDNNNVNTTNTSTNLNIGGLFKDRKQNNFFYGVWRIPTADIDRSGNFAAHMYRSVCLTLSLLHDHGDWRRLVQIFHQLRKQPPEEKRGFLGEGDRVYLARRAFNLIQPTLLNWLTQLSLLLANKISEQILKDHTFAFSSDISCITTQGFLTNEILIQIYRLHCVSYSRNSSTSSSTSSSTITTSTTANSSGLLDSTLNSLNSSLYSPTTNNTTICSTTTNTTNYSGTSTPSDVNTILAAEISGYASVLQLAYRLCPTVWDSRGPLVPLDWILQRCSELAASRSQTGLTDSSSK
ncbi:unnamed protein product [Schistosoma rodhaini]|uniref:Calcineurin-binding protein cabin-1 MEF2-binding domain-containing protein n=1 Tax=Schistosoma rodhaini TaxID=6188 RepID=A0AA85FZR0_9TREM|nr:unnamed protein product [Schistosoma rodhaini]CAH8571540.1 unnamed protein product [Schistosoma rodhaini]